jgi:ABC-type lipoprotein export system ATPase subunit
VIEAAGVTKRFVDGVSEVVAVKNVDLTINDGDFVLILGRSGSGKSTLLSMLGGLTRPDQGSVRLDGENIWGVPDSHLSRIRAEKVGFIFQFSGLLPTLTALENVMIPSLFGRNGTDNRDRATDLLTLFGLADKLGSYPSQLSGGELKRVAIARALVNNPSILLADEPTGDLDVNTELSIMEYIRKVNKTGKTVIMVTHSPELSVYADRVYRMERGSLSETFVRFRQQA